MAIPYNPSSFATNKTILQAIEELKNYLKDNPCYKIYYVNTPYVVGTYTYNLSDVDDPDDTMTEYDVVFFTNSYYAKVIVKDTNTFDIDPAVDFRGATGATGAQGVSITGATIDASNHLILTLSDGNTIDAGLISAPINVTYISGSFGTFTADEYSNLQKPDALITNANQSIIYKKRSKEYGTQQLTFDAIYFLGYSPYYYRIVVSSDRTWSSYSQRFTITSDNVYQNTASGKVLTTNGSNGATWETPSITSGYINSETATSGQVLTADGNGGSSWTTVSSGYENTVTISTTSGTFSDSDFAKLGYGDSTIIYNDGTIKYTYRLKLDTASILEFECIDATSKNNLKLIDVNKTTKAYSMTSIAMIKSATIDSGTATSGKVLTANGSGGCSWETAGGGLTLNQYTYSFSGSNFTRLRNIIKNAKGCISIGCGYVKNGITYYGALSYGVPEFGGQEGQYDIISGILSDADTPSTKFIQVCADTGNNRTMLNYFDGTNYTASTITSGMTFRVKYWNDTEITS